MPAQQLEYRLMGESAHQASVPAGRVRCSPERVEDRFLRRLDDGREERVEMAVRHRLPSQPERWGVVSLARGSRERNEDLAAPVMRDRACTREPEDRPPGERCKETDPELRALDGVAVGHRAACILLGEGFRAG